MKIRTIALCSALALVAVACGSRLSHDQLAAGAGSGGGGGTPTTSGNTKGVSAGPHGPRVGTLPLPCSKAPAGHPASGSPDQGVTADTIKIAVISDKSGAIKVPTGSVQESMQAFVAIP